MLDEESGLDELGGFLDTHYEKFAIMGIFGSVTVFLSSNWPGGSTSLAARIGIVASLLIFSLSALWIAAKCYRLLRASAGDWPDLPELGYAVILTGTMALGGAVLFASQVYSAATQLIGEFLLGILVSLVYPQIYPGDLDLPSQEEPPRYEIITTFAVFGGAYFVVSVYGPTLRSLTRSAFGLDFVLVAPLILLFGFVFFAVRESLIGVIQIVENGVSNLQNRVRGRWHVRTSLAICTISISLLTPYVHDVAQRMVGPNVGYYEVLGAPARELTLLHWVTIPTLFGVLVLAERRNDGFSPHARRAGQVVALLTVLFVVLEVVVFVPNGTHILAF